MRFNGQRRLTFANILAGLSRIFMEWKKSLLMRLWSYDCGWWLCAKLKVEAFAHLPVVSSIAGHMPDRQRQISWWSGPKKKLPTASTVPNPSLPESISIFCKIADFFTVGFSWGCIHVSSVTRRPYTFVHVCSRSYKKWPTQIHFVQIESKFCPKEWLMGNHYSVVPTWKLRCSMGSVSQLTTRWGFPSFDKD